MSCASCAEVVQCATRTLVELCRLCGGLIKTPRTAQLLSQPKSVMTQERGYDGFPDACPLPGLRLPGWELNKAQEEVV